MSSWLGVQQKTAYAQALLRECVRGSGARSGAGPLQTSHGEDARQLLARDIRKFLQDIAMNGLEARKPLATSLCHPRIIKHLEREHLMQTAEALVFRADRAEC